tara:strand:- start:1555 stop:1758 length:204 start_codon:yes stop_codon:yes gene_type:complete
MKTKIEERFSADFESIFSCARNQHIPGKDNGGADPLKVDRESRKRVRQADNHGLPEVIHLPYDAGTC